MGRRGLLNILIIFHIVALITGCKGASNGSSNTDLKIVLSPDTAFIVPGASDYGGCYDSDIIGPRVGFTEVTTTWLKTDSDFIPVSLRLVFQNNPYVSDFTSQLVDGDYTLATYLSSSVGKTSLDANSVNTSICPFAAGGIPIKADYLDRSFVTKAKVELIGLYTDVSDNNLLKSTKTSITVNIHYEP